ncbi:MAG: hypothetical protein HY699_25295 [Deltaproteobacteria bacterium]|nr:hypothetical protein [Deltaproteobacteria bacterium]
MSAPNPGYLKVELALEGIDLDAAVCTRPEIRPGLAVPLGQTPALELLLPEDVVVDAPVGKRNGAQRDQGRYQLGCEAARFFLHRGGEAAGERVDVRVIPPPQFYGKHTLRGTPMREIATVFGNFIALSPVEACGFSLRHSPCRFCAGTAAAALSPRPVAEVIQTIRAALAEGAVEYVLFNGGGSDSEDGGVAALEPYISAVKRHFDTFVAVQVHPPQTNRWIDRTYAMGVDALSYGIEIHDPQRLLPLCPGRVARCGQARYYEALAYAATIFPSGTVWSDLLVGAEPSESTIDGMNQLTRAGVLPVLSLARAGQPAQPRLAEIAPLFAHLFHAVRDAKINMDWVQELSFGVTPLEARFFVAEEVRLSVTQQFYRSRLGNLTARNLARLRRRLRVRTVSDSFDSSRL